MSIQVSYNIAKLIEWQKQGHRQVDIKIGNSRYGNNETKIWVYDFKIMEGTFIDNPDSEIDLETICKKREQAEIIRLSEKYREGADHV